MAPQQQRALCVGYQLGGRGTRCRYGGSFRTKREAKIRRDWIAGELAALRVPDLTLLREPETAPTLAEAAKRWQASRVDVADSTAVVHRTALNRALKVLGSKRIDGDHRARRCRPCRGPARERQCTRLDREDRELPRDDARPRGG
jgi:hypothetical protein